MVTSAVYVVATVVVCAVLAIFLLNPARQLLRSMYRRRLTKLGIIGKPVESTVDSNGIRYTVLGSDDHMHVGLALCARRGRWYFLLLDVQDRCSPLAGESVRLG
jgi:hypothetical protein